MKKLIFILLAVVLVAGCTAEQADLGVPKVESSLPSATGWEMNKANVINPEGLQIQKGIYKKKDRESFVMLTVVSGDSENIVKNELMALAYEIVEEPDMVNEGFVGEMVANYMKDSNFYVFYASTGTKGFVAAAEVLEPLQEFLSLTYGETLFE